MLGLLLVTWLIWMAASLHIVGYGVPLIVGVLVLLAVVSVLVALRLHSLGTRLAGEGRKSKRLLRLALPLDDPVRRRLFWGGEAVFAVVYALGALLASFAPDVWNTEKPMDMGFINAINQSGSFPPHDPWMSGESLNYYYFGHVVLAWPIKLLGLAPDAGYLLSWGVLMGLTATTVYAFAGTLWAAGREALGARAPRGGPVAAGLVAAALVTILGNLAGVKAWIKAADPPKDYAWFDPSRVIPDTINEFPSFSFLLGDLHAHVLALPFTVLALGVRAADRAARPARGRRLARGARGAGDRPLDRCALRHQLVVVSGRGGHPRRVGGHLDPLRRRAPQGLSARLARAGDRRQLHPDPAVHPELRPGGARDRVRARAAAVRQVARRHDADLRHPRLAAGGRVRGALVGLAQPLALARRRPRRGCRGRRDPGRRQPHRRDGRRGRMAVGDRRRAVARADRARRASSGS